MASAGVFLLFSMLQMRDGLFVRPHKAFWRVIMGLAVIYLVLLVFLLFQVLRSGCSLTCSLTRSLASLVAFSINICLMIRAGLICFVRMIARSCAADGR